MKYKAILLDVDGTITKDLTWTYLTKELGLSIEDHNQIFEDLNNNLLNLTDATNKLLNLWQSKGKITKEKLVEIFLRMPIREGLEKFVKKNSHIEFAIITGTMDVAAQTIASRLGIKNVYANTRMEFRENILINFKYIPDDFGEMKFNNYKKFINLHNLKPEECVMIGDGSNDVKIYNDVGYSILVRHDFNKNFTYSANREILSFKEISVIF